MAETNNPLGTGLSEAQSAISALLAPEQDNVEATEATASEEPEATEEEQYLDSEIVDEGETEVTEYDEETDYEDDDQSFDIMQQTLELDGQEMSVEELTKGYFRHSDYTRKTQALAEERKAFEQTTQRVQAQEAQYEQLLPALAAKIEQMAEPEPDWDKLYETDPALAQRAERKYNKQKQEQQEQLQAVRAEQERLAQARQQRQQQQMQAYEQEQRELLPTLIPEWGNQDVAAQEALEVRDYLLQSGFNEQDLMGLRNAMLIKMARQSMLFERGSVRTKQARVKPKGSKKKPLKAGARTTQAPSSQKRVAADIQRAKQTGRVVDAQAAIRNLLNS